MCNLSSMTRNQRTVRESARAVEDSAGNLRHLSGSAGAHGAGGVHVQALLRIGWMRSFEMSCDPFATVAYQCCPVAARVFPRACLCQYAGD